MSVKDAEVAHHHHILRIILLDVTFEVASLALP
jgi:hypothetical protein